MAGEVQERDAGLAMVRGSVASCVLITVLTVLLAAFSGHPTLDPVLRTLYFAILFGAFHSIRRLEPALDTRALRLVELGFLVLTLGFVSAAVLRLTGMHDGSHTARMLADSFERGAVFLLGVALITYGILLSLPALVESYRLLRADYVEVKTSHQHMETRIVEADRYHALGELAAGVAHDLRNPLTIVKTAARSLARKARSPEETAEHCRVMTRNIEKAERTITALLDLGKPRQTQLRDLELGALLAEHVTLVKPEARHRELTVELEHREPIAITTDPKMLGQALLNLILNAMQASAAGGRIAVKSRHLALRGRHLAAISVEDRGSGLQAVDRSKLFSPFFTTKDGGTGLGLLSCRRIVEDLGGRIGLFPRHCGGARALVLLPADPAPVLVP